MINQIKKNYLFFNIPQPFLKHYRPKKIINQDQMYQDKYLYNHFQFIY